MKIEKNRQIKLRRSTIRILKKRFPRIQGRGLIGEEVVLSRNAGKVLELVDSIRLLPEIRKDVVERYKHEIRSGTYHVYSKAVAEKILSEHRFESKF